MKKLLNKNGYTLTYAIVIIGLLLILTGSVTFVSYYNLKTSRIGGHVNTSFYANDGALEEALTKFNLYTYNAEMDAWNYIDGQTFLADADWSLFLEDIYRDVNDDTNGFTIEKANEIIACALKGEFEQVFFNSLYNGSPASHLFYNQAGTTPTERYLDYNEYTGITLTGGVTLDGAILTSLETEQFRPVNIVTADQVPEITISNFDLLKKDDGLGNLIDDTKGFRFNITSDGTYHKYNKKVQVDLSVIAPDYSFSIAMLTENFVMYKNELINNTLVANENIVFASGITNVAGDIYAYGVFDEANIEDGDNSNDTDNQTTHLDLEYDDDRDQYGGIVVGYLDDNSQNRAYDSTFADAYLTGTSTGIANVSGDVATRNAVKLETDSSNLTVTDSVYANGMYIRDTADNSSTTISKNLYLYNDLYVAGDNISITVGTDVGITPKNGNRAVYRPGQGEIWGLHEINYVAYNNYTRLGSIIVNSDAINPAITANGMFLYGVIRYNVEGKEDREQLSDNVAYKTGESFTTFKNAQYYQSQLSDDIYQSGVFSFLSQFTNKAGVGYDLISFDALADVNQVDYRSNHYFTMGYLANLDNENIYKDVSEADKSILRFREVKTYDDGDGIASNDPFYGIASTGLVAFQMEGEADPKPRVYNINKTDTETISADLKKNVLSNDVDDKINLLGYIEQYYESGDPKYREDGFFSEWLDIGSTPSVGLPTNESDDITKSSLGIYNNDSSKDIYINFPVHYDNHINIRGRYLTNSASNIENLEGTIVSRGNIYIYSGQFGLNTEVFNFEGNIISEKSIYMLGNGTKNFVNNEQLIYETIHKNSGLDTLYQTDTGKQLSISLGEYSTEPDFSVNIIDNNQIEPDDSNKITINYVSDMSSDGTSIIDSNSIVINSWTETD